MANNKNTKSAENKKSADSKNTKTSVKNSKDKNKGKKSESTLKKTSGENKPKKLTAAEKALLKQEEERLEKERKEKKKERREAAEDIVLIVTFAISILLFLSNFELGGAVGKIVNDVLFGIFGWLSYIFPFYLMGVIIVILANRKGKFVFFLKVFATFVIFVLLAAMIQIAFGETSKDLKISDYYEFAKNNKSGGGVLGGIICFFLIKWFDVIGSYVILAAAEIICIIFISGRALSREISRALKEKHKAALEKQEEDEEIYNQYIMTDEAGEYLDKTGRYDEKIVVPDNTHADYKLKDTDNDVIRAGNEEAPVKLPVDNSDISDEEFDASLKKSYLPEKKKRSFISFLKNGKKDASSFEIKNNVTREESSEINAGANTGINEEVNSEVNYDANSDVNATVNTEVNSDVNSDINSEVNSEDKNTLKNSELPGIHEEQDKDTRDIDNIISRFEFRKTNSVNADLKVYDTEGTDESYDFDNFYSRNVDTKNDADNENSDTKINKDGSDFEKNNFAGNGIFGNELNENTEETTEVSQGITPHVKEYFTDFDDRKTGSNAENKEISYSETALRDKLLYSDSDFSKTVDAVPYALSDAAKKPLNYKKPEQKNIEQTNSEHTNTEYVNAERTNQGQVNSEQIRHEQINPSASLEIGNVLTENKDSQMEFVPVKREYKYPPIELLDPPVRPRNTDDSDELRETAIKLKNTLESFGVKVTVTDVQKGPAVTRYELQPETGVKVARITSLADDIKLNLAAADIRIEAPIPGKPAVGIEVPNRENTMVTLRELIESDEFVNAKGKIPFTVGKSIDGTSVVGDIAKMPHLLIAGATGSGKSVCINTIIMSILYEFKPEDVKLIMIDPKVVELSVYNGIPHLLIPVVTDPKKAASALSWACVEMDDRYKKFAELSVRDLKGYNERVRSEAEKGFTDENYPLLPQIVIVVDELADLMMVASNDVEDSICRLAQKARACGMHLIIATQRPSVNVITGLIKANVPSRIAFAVTSGVDSRTILDNVGAEKLLGKGDMLYYPTGYPKPVRIQGCFVSDKEVNDVVDFIKRENDPAVYDDRINQKITESDNDGKVSDNHGAQNSKDDRDELFVEAGSLIIEKDKASIGMLQRAYKIGFNRAARIMDQLAEAGVVSEEDGNKPRQILMSMNDYETWLQNNMVQ